MNDHKKLIDTLSSRLELLESGEIKPKKQPKKPKKEKEESRINESSSTNNNDSDESFVSCSSNSNDNSESDSESEKKNKKKTKKSSKDKKKKYYKELEKIGKKYGYNTKFDDKNTTTSGMCKDMDQQLKRLMEKL